MTRTFGNNMAQASREVIAVYSKVLEDALLNLRMRLRCGEDVDSQEVHDLMDSLHNIPIMMNSYGGWQVEKNVDADLARYDSKWLSVEGSDLRSSLMKSLERAREKHTG